MSIARVLNLCVRHHLHAHPHFALFVEFHLPQAVCYEKRKNCLSTFERVFPTKIDVDSMFTCQAALHLWFRVLHLRERTLKFMDVCIIASFGTVLPRTVVTHTSVFHEIDDVSVFVTRCPTDQKSGLFVIVDFAANKNSFQESNNIARCFVSGVCFMRRVFFIVPPSLKSTSLLTRML